MVVVGSDGSVAGIVSERDVVRALQQHGQDLLRRPVADIMSVEVISCGPHDLIDDLAAVMTHQRIRHVPVLDGGRLAGIVSIGDVVKNRLEELSEERQQLQAYITQGAS
jgi:CBS domain-containing protein